MITEDVIIPLRWEHLTLGEQHIISQEMPDSYAGWEIVFGYYHRDPRDGVTFVEDCRVH